MSPCGSALLSFKTQKVHLMNLSFDDTTLSRYSISRSSRVSSSNCVSLQALRTHTQRASKRSPHLVRAILSSAMHKCSTLKRVCASCGAHARTTFFATSTAPANKQWYITGHIPYVRLYFGDYKQAISNNKQTLQSRLITMRYVK